MSNETDNKSPFIEKERKERAAGKMPLYIGIAVVTVALIAVGIFGGRSFFASVKGLERAIPKVSAERQVFVKMENPGIFKGKLEAAIQIMSKLRKTPSLSLPSDFADMFTDRSRFVGWTNALLSTAEKAAFLIAKDGSTHFYLAFTPKEEAFRELLSNPDNSLFTIEPWENQDGYEAWMIKPLPDPVEKLPTLYMLKSKKSHYPSGVPILVSNNPEGIDQMMTALGNGALRINVKRYNQGPDFAQFTFPVETAKGGKENAIAEMAWIEDDTSAHAQFYSNMASLMTGRDVPKSGLRGDDLPLLGNGNLAFIAAFDIPYALFTAYPKASDPVEEALDEFAKQAPLPFFQKEDLRSVMSKGRLSLVVVEEDGKKGDYSTAYIVIESKAKDSLEKLASLPKKMMKKSSLQGWDSCYTINAGGKIQALLAQRGEILMLGVGSLDSYSKKAKILPEIKDFAAPRDLANLVATPAAWDIAMAAYGNPWVELGIDDAIMRSLGIKRCTVQLRVITSEKTDIGFYWGKPAK